MSGLCSAHQGYDPACSMCRALEQLDKEASMLDEAYATGRAEARAEVLAEVTPLLDVLDDEYMRMVAGYGYNWTRITQAIGAWRMSRTKPEEA